MADTAPPPVTLAFDTSGPQVAAALLAGDGPALARVEEMARGQAERLVPLLEDLLAEAGAQWRDIGVIGVGTGPGNFTGIRISVACARGLSMALGIPAVGVDAFAAIRGVHAPPRPGWVAIPAPRGQIYLQRADASGPGAPEIAAEARLAGLDAPLLSQQDVPATRRIGNVARLARLQAPGAGAPRSRPAPLYLRPADAAPPRDAPPPILP